MTRILFLLILIGTISVNAQQTETKMGPILNDFGKVFQIENPDLLLKKDKEYKVIFDIYTDGSKGEKINPLINTVARYLNMHAQQGVPKENMKVIVIMHGAATKSVLSDTAYQKKFSTENPNSALIDALKEANVELFVCGQSYLAHGFDLNDKSSDVRIALSALTALVKYQSEGYQLITFN
ncbi:MAG: DsrE family protein [Flavobacteriaceae bacterium]|nr:DsrE family protein [Flavobacteriaceae bacterium]